VLGLPLGLLGARNITPHVTIYAASRFILNALRGVSELVFALIFVSAVGLGPFPGILALALHNAGMLGKFYAEAIEAIDPGPVEALQATGANWIQIIVFAIIPQVTPHFITYNMYRFEVSIRSATVLGLVGAGGIGFYLISSIRLFDYQETAIVLIIIVLLVVITDYLGTRLRALREAQGMDPVTKDALVALGYRVFRETFDLVAVRHLDDGKRFHARIEAHGEPIVPRGAEIDVHIDYPVERGRGHRSRAESEGIAIEMEALLDSIKRAKPSRDAPGFMACPTCGKEMASHLFDAHLKLTHQ